MDNPVASKRGCALTGISVTHLNHMKTKGKAFTDYPVRNRCISMQGSILVTHHSPATGCCTVQAAPPPVECTQSSLNINDL